jgi:hypothetical protein
MHGSTQISSFGRANAKPEMNIALRSCSKNYKFSTSLCALGLPIGLAAAEQEAEQIV